MCFPHVNVCGVRCCNVFVTDMTSREFRVLNTFFPHNNVVSCHSNYRIDVAISTMNNGCIVCNNMSGPIIYITITIYIIPACNRRILNIMIIHVLPPSP